METLLRKVVNEKKYTLYFQYGDHMGSGAIGSIQKVVDRKSGKNVAAAKRVNLKRSQSSNIQKLTEQEVTLI